MNIKGENLAFGKSKVLLELRTLTKILRRKGKKQL